MQGLSLVLQEPALSIGGHHDFAAALGWLRRGCI